MSRSSEYLRQLVEAGEYELVIALNAVSAESFAHKSDWIVKPGNRHSFERKAGEKVIVVRYCATPDSLLEQPAEAPVHIGPFPGGMPAVWAQALAARKLVDSAGVLEREFGDLKPMNVAPTSGQFMAWHIYGADWVVGELDHSQLGGAHIAYGDGFHEPTCRFACWRALPPRPPEFLIRAALDHADKK